MWTEAGEYYEFHKERIVSRPGAPLDTRPGLEIGPLITRAEALRRVLIGGDVYTLQRSDAKQLAKDVLPNKPEFDRPHTPGPGTTRTSREDVFYPHFHPGGVHPRGGGPGHVFFGKRGQGYDE